MTIHKVPEDFAALAHLRQADYQRLYQESVRDPNGFWARMGRRIDWIQPYTKVKDTSFDLKDFRIRWYYDGKLNVAANCLDRHLTKRGDKIAIIWEAMTRGSPSASRIESSTSVCANARTR
jgi:acetyl-coenzyme A synthetase (EC 6.2.1.1)